jgi:hypothetical protein
MQRLDLTGKTFGRWVVKGIAPRSYQTMWKCVCSCGVERNVSGANLRGGTSTSCGCFREENRPNLAKNRDYRGLKNPRAQKNVAKYGKEYVPSDSVWYKRAAGVFYSAKKRSIPIGFASAAEFAIYVKSIAPDRCPVFDKKFTERGNGFASLSPSIDKINPKKGYIKGNIQVISMLANCMKRDATRAELVAFAKWVLKQ